VFGGMVLLKSCRLQADSQHFTGLSPTRHSTHVLHQADQPDRLGGWDANRVHTAGNCRRQQPS
jgi:hypothetical protein